MFSGICDCHTNILTIVKVTVTDIKVVLTDLLVTVFKTENGIRSDVTLVTQKLKIIKVTVTVAAKHTA